jgi:ABC-type multidrug transport system ATPase subunit
MSLIFKSNNLSLGYGNQLVINNKDISLELSKNYEIIGKNGSGKTTLIMCISNNFIGNTFKSDIERGNNSIIEIGSTPSLISKMSLIENINYFLHNENLVKENVIEILNKYELYNFKDDLIEDFSSGMVKRSEIAIADIKNPDVLCVDEPVVYLDENGVKLLFDLFSKRESVGKTTILSSQESINALKDVERTINLND